MVLEDFIQIDRLIECLSQVELVTLIAMLSQIFVIKGGTSKSLGAFCGSKQACDKEALMGIL